jgi:hypothetical protein
VRAAVDQVDGVVLGLEAPQLEADVDSLAPFRRGDSEQVGKGAVGLEGQAVDAIVSGQRPSG